MLGNKDISLHKTGDVFYYMGRWFQAVPCTSDDVCGGCFFAFWGDCVACPVLCNVDDVPLISIYDVVRLLPSSTSIPAGEAPRDGGASDASLKR